MDLSTILLLVVIAILTIGGFFLNRSHPGTTQTLFEVSLAGAQMAEQLAASGQISRDERNQKAIDYVLQFFPKIDRTKLVETIEAAVFVVNFMQAQMTAAQQLPAPGIGTPGIIPPTTPPGESSLTLPGGY